MASGLVGAAIASGFGQGLANAAQTGMNVLGASWLQQQREAAEQRRLEVMEKYASAREARGFAHQEAIQAKGFEHADTTLQKTQDFQRGLQQEQFGQNQLAKDLDVRRAEDVAARERERLRSPEEIAKDEEAKKLRFGLGADLRMAERTENVLADADKDRLKAELLGNDPGYLASVKRLKDAQLSDGERAEAAMNVLKYEQSKEGNRLQTEYVDAVKSGDAGRIATAKKSWQAFSEKPWEDDKLTAKMASDGLREAGNEIVRLSSQMKDAMPGSPEAAALQRRLQTAQDSHDAYDTILKTRLGVQAPTTKKGGPDFANFKDPLKPDTMTATPSTTPSAPAVSPSTPMDETGAMDWKAATRESLSSPESQAAKVFEPKAPSEKVGIAGQLGDYLKDKGDMIAALPPGQNPTDASSFLAQKRQELDQRMAKEPSGMTAAAGEVPNQIATPPASEEAVTKEPIATPSTPARQNPYEDIIQRKAAQYNIPANIGRALINRESRFNPDAVGKDGEIGLTQIMPSTAQEVGADIAKLKDPETNIDAGFKYYAKLLKHYNGDHEQALQAYNYGIGNIDKGRPVPQMTKEYVADILGNAERESGPSVKTAQASPERPSYMEVLQKLPGKDRERVMNEIDNALTALKAGRINEEQFTGQILAAWTAVPGNLDEWGQGGRALAKGLIAEAKGSR